ncbi:hypothetical protein ACW2QC_07590 [Virgibacillus sp. FSP13]
MSKNPVLQDKFKEGYSAGYLSGAEYGKSVTLKFLAERFNGLYDVPGIGPKTIKKIEQQLGEQYFREGNK